MKYNPETKEQIVNLKDGRTIFKTHNGFRCFVTDKKGVTTRVSQNYYTKTLKNR